MITLDCYIVKLKCLGDDKFETETYFAGTRANGVPRFSTMQKRAVPLHEATCLTLLPLINRGRRSDKWQVFNFKNNEYKGGDDAI